MSRTSRRTALLKYEDNSAAIKASERNRYWNDPAVRLAKPRTLNYYVDCPKSWERGATRIATGPTLVGSYVGFEVS